MHPPDYFFTPAARTCSGSRPLSTIAPGDRVSNSSKTLGFGAAGGAASHVFHDANNGMSSKSLFACSINCSTCPALISDSIVAI